MTQSDMDECDICLDRRATPDGKVMGVTDVFLCRSRTLKSLGQAPIQRAFDIRLGPEYIQYQGSDTPPWESFEMEARRRQYIVRSVMWLGLTLGASASGADVPDHLSSIYQDRLAPRLTAISDLPAETPHAHRSDPGLVLLDEEVTWVRDDGSYVAALHRALSPMTEAGTARARRIVHAYPADTESLHLVYARRVSPSGEVHPVDSRAVLVESPEALSGDGVYAAIRQLVVLVTGLRSGDRVEYVVIREVAPVIPGELTDFIPLADPWPILRARRELLLPVDLAERLTHHPLGLGDLHCSTRDLGEERVGLSCDIEHLEGQRLERGREPIRQAGPGLWFSTLSSWDEIARWYDGLAPGGDRLNAELVSRARTWIEGSRSVAERIATVVERVNERVEYLSLAFGAGALQPRPAQEVWTSRWGDCKDQANLTRALLKELGIPAHLALVNAMHSGHIVREVPDYRQFNHVIVAVPSADGGYRFCDPTSGAASSEDLPPEVAARPALIVRPRCGVFAEIPPTPSSELEITFDLTLTPERELFGWVHLQGRGFQTRRLIEGILGSPPFTSERLTAFLEGAFPALHVVDIGPIEPTNGEIGLAAYLHALAPSDPRGVALHLPVADAMLADFGDQETRQTDWWQCPGQTVVRATFELPPAWKILETPAPAHNRNVGSIEIQGLWHLADGVCTCGLRHELEGSVVHPAGFVNLVRTSHSLQEWIMDPLIVGPDADSDIDDADQRIKLFEPMPSGEGQLRLVDELFPAGERPPDRRRALSATQEWFADDDGIVLEAGIKIALIEQEAGRTAESTRLLYEHLERLGDQVRPELRVWGEHLLADGLRMTGHEDEALDIYLSLARDPAVPETRRGWAAARASELIRGRDPVRAAFILQEAIGLDSPALSMQILILAKIIATGGSPHALDDTIERACRLHPNRCIDIHSSLLDHIPEALDNGQVRLANLIAEALESQVVRRTELEFLAESVAESRHQIEAAATCRTIAEEMTEHFDRSPPAWWSEGDTSGDLQRDRLTFQLQMMDGSDEHRQFVRGAVELMSRWTIRPDFFRFLLRRCADHLEAAGDSSDLVDRFRSWAEASVPDPC